jgi:hypothetical protein
MRELSLIGVLAFAIASAVVGVRLLGLSARTREIPEFAMGLAFATSGAFGAPLLVASSLAVHSEAWDAARWLAAFGSLFAYTGYLGLAVGAWRIYRPADRWPLAAIGVFAVLLLGACAWRFAVSESGPNGTGAAARLVGVAVGTAIFGWTAFESFSLHGRLRRRLRLGLADAEVTTRVLLWGIGSSAAFAMTSYGLLNRVFGGPDGGSAHHLVVSGCGLVAAVSIWLAFFPPAALRRRFSDLARTASA